MSPMETAPLLEAHNLVRVYRTGGKEVTASAGIDLAVNPGEVFGLLGPNGAGKTTLIKMIATLVLPTEGVLEVCGHDVTAQDQAVRRSIGVVLASRRSLYWKLTARENIQFFGALYGLTPRQTQEQGEEALKLVGLLDRANDRVETLSTGMQQRLQIALALLHKPRLLVLDEPTSGLDPRSAESLRDALRTLNLQGLTIILSTHNLDEAERFCDRVAIIHKGKVRAVGSPRTLRSEFGQHLVEFVLSGEATALEAFVHEHRSEAKLNVKHLGESALALSFTTSESPDLILGKVRDRAAVHGLRLTRFNDRAPTLGDVFLHLTNEEFV